MTFQFDSLVAFLQMGEHGSYVWSSYGLTFAFILAILIYSRNQRRRLYRDVMQQQNRQQQRQNQASSRRINR